MKRHGLLKAGHGQSKIPRWMNRDEHVEGFA